MAEIEKDEATKAFDPHLARRLFRHLRPYRFRAVVSVILVILSSALEVMGPAIIAVAIDLYVRPFGEGAPVGVSARIGEWLSTHGWVTTPNGSAPGFVVNIYGIDDTSAYLPISRSGTVRAVLLQRAAREAKITRGLRCTQEARG